MAKFEIQPVTEQVFQIAKNTWAIATEIPYTATKICGRKTEPVPIQPPTTLTLAPGCKIRLNSHILYAEEEETITEQPKFFTWNWNVSSLFPTMQPGEFSEALQSLHEYGQHIVAAADIVHQLKFKDYKDNLPTDLSNMASNPFHYVTVILVLIGIAVAIYIVYTKCFRPQNNNRNCNNNACNASAPPAYAMQPINFITK